MKSILTVYFSHTGSTEGIAREIQERAGGTLIELRPKNPYPEAYRAVVDRARMEIKEGTVLELEKIEADVKDYDTVIVGTPNWCGTMAPPVSSFLKKYRFSGKTIGVFCTHGGSGLAAVAEDVKKLCPESEVKPGLAIRDGSEDTKATVRSWLEETGLV